MGDPGARSYGEAVGAGGDVFERVQGSLGALPGARDGSGSSATVEGVLKAQEERLAGLTPALKAPKSRSGREQRQAPAEPHPGYRIGVTGYKYPFWALVEVRRGVRRPLRRQHRSAQRARSGAAAQRAGPAPLMPAAPQS